MVDLHAGSHLGHNAAGKFEGCGGPLVGALGRVQFAGAFHFDGLVDGFADGCASDQACNRDRVTAYVQNAAAAQIVVQHPAALFVIGVEAKRRLNQTHLADGAALDELQHLGDLGVAAIHEGFHQEDLMALGSFDDGHHLGGVHAHRLLAYDVFARFGGFDGPLGVPWVRRGDVDRLHVWVGQQRLVAGVSGRDAELVGKLVGLVLRAAANCDQFTRC